MESRERRIFDNFALKHWLRSVGPSRRYEALRKLKNDLENLGLSRSGVRHGLLQLTTRPQVVLPRWSNGGDRSLKTSSPEENDPNQYRSSIPVFEKEHRQNDKSSSKKRRSKEDDQPCEKTRHRFDMELIKLDTIVGTKTTSKVKAQEKPSVTNSKSSSLVNATCKSQSTDSHKRNETAHASGSDAPTKTKVNSNMDIVKQVATSIAIAMAVEASSSSKPVNDIPDLIADTVGRGSTKIPTNRNHIKINLNAQLHRAKNSVKTHVNSTLKSEKLSSSFFSIKDENSVVLEKSSSQATCLLKTKDDRENLKKKDDSDNTRLVSDTDRVVKQVTEDANQEIECNKKRCREDTENENKKKLKTSEVGDKNEEVKTERKKKRVRSKFRKYFGDDLTLSEEEQEEFVLNFKPHKRRKKDSVDSCDSGICSEENNIHLETINVQSTKVPLISEQPIHQCNENVPDSTETMSPINSEETNDNIVAKTVHSLNFEQTDKITEDISCDKADISEGTSITEISLCQENRALTEIEGNNCSSVQESNSESCSKILQEHTQECNEGNCDSAVEMNVKTEIDTVREDPSELVTKKEDKPNENLNVDSEIQCIDLTEESCESFSLQCSDDSANSQTSTQENQDIIDLLNLELTTDFQITSRGNTVSIHENVKADINENILLEEEITVIFEKEVPAPAKPRTEIQENVQANSYQNVLNESAPVVSELQNVEKVISESSHLIESIEDEDISTKEKALEKNEHRVNEENTILEQNTQKRNESNESTLSENRLEEQRLENTNAIDENTVSENRQEEQQLKNTNAVDKSTVSENRQEEQNLENTVSEYKQEEQNVESTNAVDENTVSENRQEEQYLENTNAFGKSTVSEYKQDEQNLENTNAVDENTISVNRREEQNLENTNAVDESTISENRLEGQNLENTNAVDQNTVSENRQEEQTGENTNAIDESTVSENRQEEQYLETRNVCDESAIFKGRQDDTQSTPQEHEQIQSQSSTENILSKDPCETAVAKEANFTEPVVTSNIRLRVRSSTELGSRWCPTPVSTSSIPASVTPTCTTTVPSTPTMPETTGPLAFHHAIYSNSSLQNCRNLYQDLREMLNMEITETFFIEISNIIVNFANCITCLRYVVVKIYREKSITDLSLLRAIKMQNRKEFHNHALSLFQVFESVSKLLNSTDYKYNLALLIELVNGYALKDNPLTLNECCTYIRSHVRNQERNLCASQSNVAQAPTVANNQPGTNISVSAAGLSAFQPSTAGKVIVTGDEQNRVQEQRIISESVFPTVAMTNQMHQEFQNPQTFNQTSYLYSYLTSNQTEQVCNAPLNLSCKDPFQQTSQSSKPAFVQNTLPMSYVTTQDPQNSYMPQQLPANSVPVNTNLQMRQSVPPYSSNISFANQSPQYMYQAPLLQTPTQQNFPTTAYPVISPQNPSDANLANNSNHVPQNPHVLQLKGQPVSVIQNRHKVLHQKLLLKSQQTVQNNTPYNASGNVSRNIPQATPQVSQTKDKYEIYRNMTDLTKIRLYQQLSQNFNFCGVLYVHMTPQQTRYIQNGLPVLLDLYRFLDTQDIIQKYVKSMKHQEPSTPVHQSKPEIPKEIPTAPTQQVKQRTHSKKQKKLPQKCTARNAKQKQETAQVSSQHIQRQTPEKSQQESETRKEDCNKSEANQQSQTNVPEQTQKLLSKNLMQMLQMQQQCVKMTEAQLTLLGAKHNKAHSTTAGLQASENTTPVVQTSPSSTACEQSNYSRFVTVEIGEAGEIRVQTDPTNEHNVNKEDQNSTTTKAVEEDQSQVQNEQSPRSDVPVEVSTENGDTKDIKILELLDLSKLERDVFKEDGSNLPENDVTKKVVSSSESSECSEFIMPNILDVRSISPNSFEKMEEMIPSSCDLVSLKGEDKVILAENVLVEIKEEEFQVCLCCDRVSTVVCELCLQAHYCSKECSEFHWKQEHHKECKPHPLLIRDG